MLYDKPVRLLLVDCVDELGDEFTSEQAVTWFSTHYPLVDNKTVRAHLRAFSVNDANRRHYSFGRNRQGFLFKSGRSTYERYDAEVHGLFDLSGVELDDTDESTEDLVQEVLESAEFALEVYLEDFLLTNWLKIAWGAPLALYEAQVGHQYVTPVGRLDFLAVDTSDDALVVIELKRGRPADQVVGQALRYMGWITHNLADGRPVRGLIIAADIDERLKYAASMVNGLRLMSYEITFGLTERQLDV